MIPWLNECLELMTQGKDGAAIDVMFEAVDDLLLDGKFEEVDAQLDELDVTQFNSTMTVAILSITYPIRDREARKRLADRARQHIYNIAPDRAERLLKNLVPIQENDGPAK